MRRTELKIWRELWDEIPVIGAEGEIDLSTVDGFRIAVSEIVSQNPNQIIFDLRLVSFIDASGLGVLVAAHRRLPGRNSVTVITDQNAVLQALEITSLDRVFCVRSEPVHLSQTI